MSAQENSIAKLFKDGGVVDVAPFILIVEDEAIPAEDLADQLSAKGYRVCGIADNGNTCLEMVEQFRPDVIIMDIMIKGEMDGIETARRINRRFQLPVVFATAYSDPHTVQRAIKAAPYGYITKPYQSHDVCAAIEVARYKYVIEKRLKDSERWFSSTLRCVADGVIATDLDSMVKFLNPAAEQLLGGDLNDFLEHSALDVLHLSDVNDKEHPVFKALTNKILGPVIDFGYALKKISGEEIIVDLSTALICDDQNQVLGTVIAIRDVSARLAAEQALRQSEDRFRTAFEFAPIGMALISMVGEFLQSNAALCKMLDVDPAILHSIKHLDFIHPDDHASQENNQLQLLANEKPCVQFEMRYVLKEGKIVTVLASVALLRTNDIPVCYMYQIHDISEQKLYENYILRMAHYDSLTGLANRTSLTNEIERHIIHTRRNQKPFALVFCDLDHFKQVNDSLGHEAGDELLRVIAKRLIESVRESDIVARLGGDEFVILLANIVEAEKAALVVRTIMTKIALPVDLGDGVSVRVGSSFGIAMYPNDGEDSSTLLRHADSALYEAKVKGRNNLQFYSKNLTARVEQRLRLSADLRNALENNEFVLHFQPIIDLRSGCISSLEALVRWQHPTLGIISPDIFIPYAEESGLIVALGEWVLNEACAARMRWQAFEETPISVAINVSSKQFISDNLVPTVTAAIQRNQVNPADMVLELTEQILLDTTERNLGLIEELRTLGIAIALDDFGVGYSSLSYIVKFAPDKVKIDRSFMSDEENLSANSILVELIVTMGEKLQMKTVAEGVETKKQLAFLQACGCNFGQGYFFSKPLTESSVHELLQKRYRFDIAKMGS